MHEVMFDVPYLFGVGEAKDVINVDDDDGKNPVGGITFDEEACVGLRLDIVHGEDGGFDVFIPFHR
jgi:hypothetical protein